MTKEQKDRLITYSFSGAIAVITVFLGFALNTSDLDARELNEKIDSKADKKELEAFEERHNRDHDRIDIELGTKADKEDLKFMQEWLIRVEGKLDKVIEDKNGG